MTYFLLIFLRYRRYLFNIYRVSELMEILAQYKREGGPSASRPNSPPTCLLVEKFPLEATDVLLGRLNLRSCMFRLRRSRYLWTRKISVTRHTPILHRIKERFLVISITLNISGNIHNRKFLHSCWSTQVHLFEDSK